MLRVSHVAHGRTSVKDQVLGPLQVLTHFDAHHDGNTHHGGGFLLLLCHPPMTVSGAGLNLIERKLTTVVQRRVESR